MWRLKGLLTSTQKEKRPLFSTTFLPYANETHNHSAPEGEHGAEQYEEWNVGSTVLLFQIDTLSGSLLFKRVTSSDAWRSFDDYLELNVCYYRYYMKLPVLAEGDYDGFGSILPLGCSAARERLDLCLSIWLITHRNTQRTHTHADYSLGYIGPFQCAERRQIQ